MYNLSYYFYITHNVLFFMDLNLDLLSNILVNMIICHLSNFIRTFETFYQFYEVAYRHQMRERTRWWNRSIYRRLSSFRTRRWSSPGRWCDIGLVDGSISIAAGLRSLSRWEGGFEVHEELIFVYKLEHVDCNFNDLPDGYLNHFETSKEL